MDHLGFLFASPFCHTREGYVYHSVRIDKLPSHAPLLPPCSLLTRTRGTLRGRVLMFTQKEFMLETRLQPLRCYSDGRALQTLVEVFAIIALLEGWNCAAVSDIWGEQAEIGVIIVGKIYTLKSCQRKTERISSKWMQPCEDTKGKFRESVAIIFHIKSFF